MGNPKTRHRFDVPISSKRSANRTQRDYQPADKGINRALIDAGIVVGTTLFVTLLLLGISGQISDTTAGNLIPRSAAPLPQLMFSPTPVASVQPTRSPTPEMTPVSTPDDGEVQAAIEQKLGEVESISALGITTTVTNGQVVLAGTVPTDELKQQVEKLVRGVKGVKRIENQIIVSSASP